MLEEYLAILVYSMFNNHGVLWIFHWSFLVFLVVFNCAFQSDQGSHLHIFMHGI